MSAKPENERREEIARIIDPEIYSRFSMVSRANRAEREAIAFAKAAEILALPPLPQQGETEPVAWRIQPRGGSAWSYHSEVPLPDARVWSSEEYTIQPLYAAAPLAPTTDPVSGEGWIKHDGSAKSPVEGCNVEMRFRDGDSLEGFVTPGVDWSHADDDGDVMEYRVLSPAKPVSAGAAEDGLRTVAIEAIALLDVAIAGTVFTKPSNGRVVVNVAKAQKVLDGLRSALQAAPSAPVVTEEKATSPGAKIGQENREAVREFFASHLGCTNAEAAATLRLSVMAVGRHVATLRSEWVPTWTAALSGGSDAKAD